MSVESVVKLDCRSTPTLKETSEDQLLFDSLLAGQDQAQCCRDINHSTPESVSESQQLWPGKSTKVNLPPLMSSHTVNIAS